MTQTGSTSVMTSPSPRTTTINVPRAERHWDGRPSVKRCHGLLPSPSLPPIPPSITRATEQGTVHVRAKPPVPRPTTPSPSQTICPSPPKRGLIRRHSFDFPTHSLTSSRSEVQSQGGGWDHSGQGKTFQRPIDGVSGGEGARVGREQVANAYGGNVSVPGWWISGGFCVVLFVGKLVVWVFFDDGL